jgi:hypothetical protein
MKIRLFYVAALVLIGAAACDVGKISAQSSARDVMVGTLIATPEIVIRPEAIAGFDASFPGIDAGFVFDGGFAFDGGFNPNGLVIPAQTGALAFFGERQGDGVSAPPVPLAGTTMFVELGNGQRFSMKDESQGGFSITSLDNGNFTYVEGEKYTFTANQNAENHVAEIAAAPPKERIVRFHPDEGYLELNAGEDFTFLRADPPEGVDRDLGFVTVVPISRDGQRGDPTFTNVPKDAFTLLKLVAVPASYRRTEVTVPGSAFPEANHNYLILMQTARIGGPVSNNLFIGSAIMAGTAEVGIVKTRP